MNESIGLTTRVLLAETLGKAGRSGLINAQCASHWAPWATQRFSNSISPAVSGFFPESGGAGTAATRIASRGADQFEIAMHSTTGEILFYDGAWKGTSTTLSLNAWTHVAVTWDGTSVRTYINRVLVSTVAGGRALGGRYDRRLGNDPRHSEVTG